MEKNSEKDLVFYHVGRIVKIIDSKNSRNFDKKKKAVTEMWDNNIITCEAGSTPAVDGDFVVVRFIGVPQGTGILMHPTHITDILSKEAGEEVWLSYKSFLDRSKPSHPMTG